MRTKITSYSCTAIIIGKVPDCLLISSVVFAPSGDLCRPGWRAVRRLHGIKQQLKSISKVHQKYTLISLCREKKMKKVKKSHSIFFSINHPFKPSEFHFPSFPSSLSWQHIDSRLSPFARRMIIPPWHFPALQRDGLGEYLVCWSTQARSLLRRCRTWPHQLANWQQQQQSNVADVFSWTFFFF